MNECRKIAFKLLFLIFEESFSVVEERERSVEEYVNSVEELSRWGEKGVLQISNYLKGFTSVMYNCKNIKMNLKICLDL